MQTTPGGCTVEIAHTVFTAVLLAPRRFGFAVVLSGIAICNQHLAKYFCGSHRGYPLNARTGLVV